MYVKDMLLYFQEKNPTILDMQFKTLLYSFEEKVKFPVVKLDIYTLKSLNFEIKLVCGFYIW